MSRTPIVALVLALMGLVLWPARASAQGKEAKEGKEGATAAFALIIGSNQSVDANLAPLRYADDDAARYLDLFRLLGARTYLLTRLDDNTRRIHPQAVAEAKEPRKASFDEAVTQLVDDVAQASARGVDPVVYFVYAGHGNVENGKGYITLEDARINGADLAAIFARLRASRIHVIADACGSYFLAYSRGPGGERRPLDFGLTPALSADPRVGLLLSTSSARESHEWDAFQAGVFSHEVRSGLYGAADADGDGVVSYREIAAFIARANSAVPNERYRPDVHARAPGGSSTLLDLRRANRRRLEIDGSHAAHYYLEDARGVRIADVHNAPGQNVSLLRPAPTSRLYLRRLDDDREFLVVGQRPLDETSEGASDDILALADLTADEPRTAARGAAHESFGRIFEVAFDQRAVDDYRAPAPPPGADDPPARVDVGPNRSLRRPIALGAIGLGVVAIGTGAALSISTSNLANDSTARSQATIARRNDDIHTQTSIATGLYIGGGVAAAAGAVLLLWPEAKHVQVSASANGASVGYATGF